MTDFFGGSQLEQRAFYGRAHQPCEVPLSTNLSGPEGINGDPDGRYNFNDSLLSGERGCEGLWFPQPLSPLPTTTERNCSKFPLASLSSERVYMICRPKKKGMD